MMQVSTAKIEITPTLATNPYLAGYGRDETPRMATNDMPYEPLYARCVVFWDNGSPRAMVVADVLGFPRSLHHMIRQRVIGLHSGWNSSDFILQATHTHNGPVLIDAPDPYLLYNLTDQSLVIPYSVWLADQIVALVQRVLATPPNPCTLDYQVGSQCFSYNRERLSYNETVVPILVARNSSGTPVAILFSYGCHPVSAGQQTQYDGDFPAGACTEIETATGAFAMFLQGPAGDQNPFGSRGFPLRDQLSSQLGNAVLTAVQTPGRMLAGPILTSYQEINLPLDITDTTSNLAAVKIWYQARLSSEFSWYRRHAGVMIEQLQTNSFVTTVPLPLQVWKLQGRPMLRLAFTGGELVSGYGAYFRNQYGGADRLLIVGYANEIPAYIPSDELLPPLCSGGSYAGGWHTDFPGIAGHSQCFYGCYLGHFLAGTDGVESVLISALTTQLT
jgi:hypothetical protein